MKQFIKKHQRTIAIAMMLAVTIVMLFSSCYIALEANHHHDCAGSSCPICAMIAQCENHLKQFVTGPVVIITMMMGICLCRERVESARPMLPFETLITRKVRLNN